MSQNDIAFLRHIVDRQTFRTCSMTEFGCASHIGRRKSQEDSLLLELDIGGSELCLFGVFDGHNGAHVAEFSSLHFSKYLAGMQVLSNDLSSALVRTLCVIDEVVGNLHESGSTACIAALEREKVWLVNLGDSRAVVFTSTFDVRLETVDHDEVVRSDCGELAVSRSLGDFRYKPYGLTCIADAYELSVTPGESIVIASDGLWDVMSTRDVGRFMSTFEAPSDEENTTPRSKAQQLANAIMMFAMEYRNASDNISVIVVLF
jgi:serine/threonine protein phosphatase PrpC